MKDSHNLPHAEWREHDLSADCWCHPRRDEEFPSVIVHNSMDGRELYERGERKPS